VIDLDDEDDFFAKLQGRMKAQAEAGLEVGKDEVTEQTHSGFTIRRKPIVELAPAPIEYDKPPLTKKLATGDLETDPFERGLVVQPFSAGFYTTDSPPGWNDFEEFWGEDCVTQFFDYVTARVEATGEDFVIYFHNGGKFDFNYFIEYMDADTRPFFIDKRMVKTIFAGVEFRDSYSLLPVALKKLKNKSGSEKKDIEMWKLKKLFREKYKEEILMYQRFDCITLYDALEDFINRFGWRLTIAGTATPYIAHFHGFDCVTPETDAELRPYFSGGRVQCFETGILIAPKGKRFLMVDANSMYPAAMANFLHPVSIRPIRGKALTDATDFARIEAINRGCLGSGNGLEYDFTRTSGEFLASMHEIRAGLDTGTLEIKRVIQAYSFAHKVSFREFVEHFYSLRNTARSENDLAGVEFYKLVMNSGYGRFAMNTAGYKDYLVNPSEPPLPLWSKKLVRGEDGKITHSPNGWRITRQDAAATIWERPARGAGTKFVNVATAASITGAARSVLWRAICSADRALYCDTDSIICERFNGDLDEKRLGAWKVEATGDAVCIAGKKMYAFLTLERPEKFDPEKHEEIQIEGRSFYLLKKAHKGVQLTGQQIVQVCGGEVIEHQSDAPTFKLDGSVHFQTRRIRMTTANPVEQMELEL
jgi:DNA polymerase type B, organellar and viral